MNSLVSIITAAYHAQDFIERPVVSVLSQTYPHWEMIIASDDSQDYQQILSDKGIRDPRIRFTATGGVATGESSARNTALRQARGDVATVLDADDAIAQDKFERLLPKVKTYGAATSDIRLINSANNKEYTSLAKTFPAGLLSAKDYICANLHTYSILTWDRRRVEVTWDENIAFCADLVFGLTMYNALEGIYFDPLPLHYYYKHAASMTNQAGDNNALQAQCAFIIQNFQNIIERSEKGDLSITNAAAKDALKRYLKTLIALEEKFFAEMPDDPVMGWYDFLSRNRQAAYDW